MPRGSSAWVHAPAASVVERLQRLQNIHIENLLVSSRRFGEVVEQMQEIQESESLALDRFFKGRGNETLVTMTNFTFDELNALYRQVEVELVNELSTGRGRKTSITPKDVFFIALVELKYYGTWEHCSVDFGMTGSTLERLCHRVYQVIKPVLYTAHVVRVKMTDQRETENTFANFSNVLYATDVNFLPSHRPSGRFEEARQYFSGKHKLYGLKIECPVAPPGLTVDMSPHYVGSVSDLTIFRKRKAVHRAILRKIEDELSDSVERDEFGNCVKY